MATRSSASKVTAPAAEAAGELAIRQQILNQMGVRVPAYAQPLARSGAFRDDRSVYNLKASNTRRLAAAFAKPAQGALTHIGILGDSLSMGANSSSLFSRLNAWPIAFREACEAQGIASGGDGIVQASWFPTAEAGARDPRWTYTGNWTNMGGYMQSPSDAGNGLAAFQSSQPATQIDIWYFDNSAAFTVSVDGGSVVSPPRGGNFALVKYSFTGLSDAAHRVVVNATTTSPVYLAAAVGMRSSGMVVHNGGIFGSLVQGWANSSGDITLQPIGMRTIMASYSPSAYIVPLGANDISNGRTPAQIKSDYTTLLNNYAGTADIVLVAETTSPSYDNAAFESLMLTMYEVADIFDCPLFDLRDRFGTAANMSAQGYYGPDNLHHSNLAMRAWGQSFAAAFAPPGRSSAASRAIIKATDISRLSGSIDHVVHTTNAVVLPLAAGNTFSYKIRNISPTSPIIIYPASGSSDTLAEASAFVIQPYDSWEFISDGTTNWGVF